MLVTTGTMPFLQRAQVATLRMCTCVTSQRLIPTANGCGPVHCIKVVACVTVEALSETIMCCDGMQVTAVTLYSQLCSAT